MSNPNADVRTGNQGGSNGFTLIELLVVIAIIAILAAILVPAVQNALQTAGRTKVMAGLHGFGLGVHAYTHSHDGVLPGPTNGGQGPNYSQTKKTSLVYHLWPYLDGEEPKARSESSIDVLYDGRREAKGFPTIYLRNGAVKTAGDETYDVFGYPSKGTGTLGDDNRPSPLEVVTHPSLTWLMHDTDKSAQPGNPNWGIPLPEKAFHGLNIVLFFDAHVETFEKPKVDLY